MKGLDIVRRDWCDLAKDSGKYVFDPLRERMNVGTNKQKNQKIVMSGELFFTFFYILFVSLVSHDY